VVELTPEDRAMLDYAVKLTLTPHDVTEADISTLHSSGFDETAILDLCQVVSYYNYVNRLADGLGVELEKFWEAEELTMTQEEFDSMLAERR
jgi:uncharacterized peroxidase-related enzyme